MGKIKLMQSSGMIYHSKNNSLIVNFCAMNRTTTIQEIQQKIFFHLTKAINV